MPSSKDRQRIEVPIHFYEQLAQIAETEDRTITSVLNQLLFQALMSYQPTWIPSKHLSRFNEHAQHVLSLAREEALSFNHNFIGTEHLLLGLLREQGSLAALALEKLGITLDPVRTAVEEKIGRRDGPIQEEIDYVPRVSQGPLTGAGRSRAAGKRLRSHRAYLVGNCARWRRGCCEYS